jgi:menaquinone-specific isochorismate synthase
MSTQLTAVEDAPALVVRTRTVSDPGPLLELLPETEALAWVRRGEGIVGWGVAARLDVDGDDRFAEAQAWWSDLAGSVVVRDDLELPGTGLVAFGSFGFSPGSAAQLVVPEVLVGHRVVDGRPQWWVTTTTTGALPPAPDLPDGPRRTVLCRRCDLWCRVGAPRVGGGRADRDVAVGEGRARPRPGCHRQQRR